MVSDSLDSVKDRDEFNALYNSARDLLRVEPQWSECGLRWMRIPHTHPTVRVFQGLKILYSGTGCSGLLNHP